MLPRSSLLLPLVASFTLLVGTAAAQAADAQATWAALAQPTFDPNRVAVVENVELRRDAAALTLVRGRIGLAPTGDGRFFAAAFKGTGVLRLAPTLPWEKQQLAFHSGGEALEAEFTEAVFLFTDATLEDLQRQAQFQSGPAADLEELYRDRNGKWTHYGLNWELRLLKNLLAETPSDRPLFVAELNTRQHDWLTLIVDAADPEQVELVRFDPTRQARDVWTKFPANGRRPEEAFADPLAHHDYSLEGYALDVTVNDDTELEAEAEVKLVMRRPGQRVLLFNLDPNLRVSEVTDAAGRSLGVFQPEDPKDRWFLGRYLAVVSREPFAPGPQTLRFRYAGKRIVRKFGAGSYFCQSFGWYPSYGMGRYSLTNNEFAARSAFAITLRVPSKFMAVAVGTKVEEREEDQYRMTRWQSDIPLAVAGFAYGDYKLVTEKVGETQVEVYANKQADDAWRTPMWGGTGGFVDPAGAGEALLAIQSINPARMAPEMANEVANSLRVMEKYFGPYPYKKLAVTNIPYSYGQGWPGLLYVSILSFLDSFQRNVFGVRDHVQLTDFFRAHETSHQWWGHAVGWKSYHDQWLSEGFAEFSGILYTMHRRKQGEYLRLLRDDRDWLLERDREEAVYEQIGPIYAGIRLSSGKHPGGYPVIVYGKGGWVLHMIRMMLYDSRHPQDPDSAFIALMQDFTRTFHNRPASTEDFKRTVEKHMAPWMDVEGNGKMDWFFDSWVYGTGVPRFELQYNVEPGPAPGQFVLKGSLRTSGVPDSFRTIVPLFLHQGKGFLRAGWLRVNGPETPFAVTLGFKPDKVTINEGESLLCTLK